MNFKNYKDWRTVTLSFVGLLTALALAFCIFQPTKFFIFLPKANPAYAADLNSNDRHTFVYVVDSGVDRSKSNLYFHTANGYNAIKDEPGALNDCTGHGTGVANVISQMTDIEQVTIVPVKTSECSNVNDPVAIVRGINWIINNHPKGAHTGVINLSFGYVDNIPFLDGIQDAVQDAINAGFVVVISAGNESTSRSKDKGTSVADACNSTPANVPDAITVGSAGYDGIEVTRSDFSNSGSCIDVFAPGEMVRTIVKKSDGNLEEGYTRGTSFAAPYVAAIAAEELYKNPWKDRTEIETYIKSIAIKGVIMSNEEYPLEPDVPVHPEIKTPNLYLNLEYNKDSDSCDDGIFSFLNCR